MPLTFCMRHSRVSNNVVLNPHTDGGLALFCFASSIPLALSQGEDYSENGSSKAQVCLLNNCKIFPGTLGYFDLDAEGSHRP